MAEKHDLAHKIANTKKFNTEMYLTYTEIADKYCTTAQKVRYTISKYRRFEDIDIRTKGTGNGKVIALNMNDIIDMFSNAISLRKSPRSRMSKRVPKMLPSSIRSIALENKTKKPKYYTYAEIGELFDVEHTSIRDYINRLSKKNEHDVSKRKRGHSKVVELNFNDVIELCRTEAKKRCSPDILHIAESKKHSRKMFLTWKDLSIYFDIPELQLRALRNQYEKKHALEVETSLNEAGIMTVDINSIIELARTAAYEAGYPY